MARIVDKKEKRIQIIKAAMGEFAKKGFARTTINDIALAAGTGKGTIYEYFETKEEIVHHSFSYLLRMLSPNFEDILLSESSGRDKLIQILEFYADIDADASTGTIELIFDFLAEGLRDGDAGGIVNKEMRNMYTSARKVIADVILEGIEDGSLQTPLPPGTLASVMIAIFDGLMVQWLLDRSLIDLRRTKHTLIDLLLHGIGGGVDPR